MKKTLVAVLVAASAFFVASCSTADPSDGRTSTNGQPSFPDQSDSSEISSQQMYLNFVREQGGIYAATASDLSIINLGNIICEGYRKGLSQDDITGVLAVSLIENNMNNEQGYVLAAALIVGAERYLCYTYA
jgi:hypothetical protein